MRMLLDGHYYEYDLCWIVEKVKELKKYVEEFDEKYNTNLSNTIDETLEKWKDSGELNELIKQGVFPDFISSLSNLQKTTNNLQTSKVGKNERDTITMNMLTNEVKTAITGGSTAVVGENSVGMSELKNNSVGYVQLTGTASAPATQYTYNFGMFVDNKSLTVTVKGIYSDTNDLYYFCAGRRVTLTTTTVSLLENTSNIVGVNKDTGELYAGVYGNTAITPLIRIDTGNKLDDVHYSCNIGQPITPGMRVFLNNVPVYEPYEALYCKTPFKYDLYNNKLLVPLTLRLTYNGYSVALTAIQGKEYSLTPRTTRYFVYDTVTENVAWLNYTDQLSHRYICLGWIDPNTGNFSTKYAPVAIGQSIVAFGDSIMNNVGCNDSTGEVKLSGGFYEQIATKFGTVAYNSAVSGSGFVVQVNGGNTIIDQLTKWNTERPYTAIAHILMAGVNDFRQNIAIGDENTEGTFTYAVNQAFQYIRKNFNTEGPFLICTPFPYKNENVPNTIGKIFKDYIDVIKQYAAKYKLMLFDLHEWSDIDITDDDCLAVLMPDGLHPSLIEHTRVAPVIASKIALMKGW